ncbi:hypothetical protein BgiMline_031384, partial [Biomphalaria glabrata]
STVLSSTVQRFSSQKLYWAGQSSEPACNSNNYMIWHVQGLDNGKRVCLHIDKNPYLQLDANYLCK